MGYIKTNISDQEVSDLAHGLILAMKELDKYKDGNDRKLADRLEIFLDRIRKEHNSKADKIRLRKEASKPKP